MSTRACYGFKDDRGTHWVYVHHDGYPEGAALKFDQTLKSKNVWSLPRFEADEFAAGFVTTCKNGESGGVRLSYGHSDYGNIEYVYLVCAGEHDLYLKAFDRKGRPVESLYNLATAHCFYDGPLARFIEENCTEKKS